MPSGCARNNRYTALCTGCNSTSLFSWSVRKNLQSLVISSLDSLPLAASMRSSSSNGTPIAFSSKSVRPAACKQSRSTSAPPGPSPQHFPPSSFCHIFHHTRQPALPACQRQCRPPLAPPSLSLQPPLRELAFEGSGALSTSNGSSCASTSTTFVRLAGLYSFGISSSHTPPRRPASVPTAPPASQVILQTSGQNRHLRILSRPACRPSTYPISPQCSGTAGQRSHLSPATHAQRWDAPSCCRC